MVEWNVLTVAGFTFGDVGVVVAERMPGGGICVAVLAVVGVMGGGNGRFRITNQRNFRDDLQRHILLMTRCALNNACVVKFGYAPGAGVVAIFASASKVGRIYEPNIRIADKEKVIRRGCYRFKTVAVGTRCGCVGIGSVGMAAFAGQIGVSIC